MGLDYEEIARQLSYSKEVKDKQWIAEGSVAEVGLVLVTLGESGRRCRIEKVDEADALCSTVYELFKKQDFNTAETLQVLWHMIVEISRRVVHVAVVE